MEKIYNLNGYANQFVIDNGNVQTFQSYDSFICKYDWYEHKLIVNWNKFDYSRTTMRHLNRFLKDVCALDLSAKDLKKLDLGMQEFNHIKIEMLEECNL